MVIEVCAVAERVTAGRPLTVCGTDLDSPKALQGRRTSADWAQVTCAACHARRADVTSSPEALSEDAILEITSAWHDGAFPGKELHEALGWTWEQYARWVEDPLRKTAEDQQ